MLSPILRSNSKNCICLLLSCNSMHQFLQIQGQIYRNHLFLDQLAASKMVEFCVGPVCGNPYYARKVFDQIAEPTTFAWNNIIKGYANSPFPNPSIHLFIQMMRSNAVPNSYTYPFVIKACSSLAALKEGRQIHCLVLKLGIDYDLFSINGLIHMYSSCGEIDSAHCLFSTCLNRDIASWNSMVSGYMKCGLVDNAQKLFDEMPERDVISWNAMINGYVKCADIYVAQNLFDRMPCRNIESYNTMIAGYAKCGLLDISRKIFDEMPKRNTVSWSAIITAYAQGNNPSEALNLFQLMRCSGLKPNGAAITSALSACAHQGSLNIGRKIHRYIDDNKMNIDSILGTALIDMYAKCGSIDDAYSVFISLSSKDVLSWTTMIVGLAANGHGEKALELFDSMEKEGIEPNEVTFLGVLCACSHRGWVKKAQNYFELMKTCYSIQPQDQHYSCMVDTLGRAGLIEEALSFILSIPNENNSELWLTLLGACWIHGNTGIAEYIIDRVTELHLSDGSVYILLSNIYAMVGRFDDARKTRGIMESKGLQRSPGHSLIEVDGVVHKFYVGDRMHLENAGNLQKD